MSLIVTVNIRC